MRKAKTEPDEQGRFLSRMVRAFGRRVGGTDPQGLAAMAQVDADLAEAMERAVHALRDQGFSWSEIAAPLGISKQAAAQRWGEGPSEPGEGRREVDRVRSGIEAARAVREASRGASRVRTW